MSPEEIRDLEERLATCERRFRYLLEQHNDAIASVLHATRRLVGVNPAFEELFGISNQAAMEMSFSELAVPDQAPVLEHLLDDHLAGLTLPRAARVSMRRLDAPAAFPAELSFHRLPSGPRPRVTIVSIRDLTERLQAAERLREAEARLAQQDKLAALGRLVAGVTHEIHSPLGAVRSNADVIARAIVRLREHLPDRDGPVARSLDAIEAAGSVSTAAAARLHEVVHALRTFACLDEAEQKHVDVHEGIESALSLLGPTLGRRIRVVRRYGEVPRLLCRPGALNQVFMTLLANAADAIDGEGTVEVSTRSEAGSIVVVVRDTGRGIAPEHLKGLFEPGFAIRGDRVAVRLGLATTARIVAEHRGTIAVESTPGVGSVFTVRLGAGG